MLVEAAAVVTFTLDEKDLHLVLFMGWGGGVTLLGMVFLFLTFSLDGKGLHLVLCLGI